MSRKNLAGAGLLAALLVLLAISVVQDRSEFDPPEREGPPALVMTDAGPVVWVLQKQEERKTRLLGAGRYTVGRLVTEHLFHFTLVAVDAGTLVPRWSRRLRTVNQRDGGYSARARLLGPDGQAVWVFLVDGPVALSSADGSVMIDDAGIVAQDPSLAGVLASEADRYAYFGGLLLTTVDGRRKLLRMDGAPAADFLIDDANRDAVQRAEFAAWQWNGLWKTRDFLVRTGTVGSDWAGLYTADEARSLAADRWGEQLREPERVHDDGELARRRFWRARIAPYQPWADRPAVDRIEEVLPVPDAAEYLQGGMLAAAGRREPLALAGPAGVLVLHRTRIDADGRLVLSRVDEAFHERWRRELPLAELGQRWELPDGRLLFYGSTPWQRGERSGVSEYLLRIDPPSGDHATWDVIAGAPLAP